KLGFSWFSWRMIVRVLSVGWVTTTFLLGTAWGAEVCVVCSEPDATYRCVVEHGEKAQQFRGGGRVLQYLCITELAKAGHHASCRISSDVGSGCLGDVRTVSASGAELREQSEAAAANAKAAQGPASGQADTPPKTLVELARRTKDSVDGSAKSAGNAV